MKKPICSFLTALALALATLIPVVSFAADKKLEVFSWWTSGGEAAALDALFAVYKKADPGVEIINATVAGGGGSAARPVLQARLAGGDPPDSWQSHPGSELIGQYVEAGYCEPVNDIYQSENWEKVIPNDLMSMLTKNEKIYGVLAGVHRGNTLWFNKKLIEKHGITIGDTLTLDEFFAIADRLKAAGVTPLAVGDSGIWATAHLFENTLLATVGPQGWLDLFAGRMAWDDPKVKQGAENYVKLLSYQNSDHAALSWDQAVKLVIEGKAAFTSMGDWTYGELAKAKLKDKEDFGWVSHPGTDGSFTVVADAFTLAKGAPHKQDTIRWLKAVGSKEGQEAFNPLKGSIPARTDVDKSKFGAYHNWSMNSFTKDTLLPSLVHGEAAPAGFQQAVNDAITILVVDKKTDAFIKTLVQAAKDAGISQ
ncbi:MAG TPA: ABC transporter substrate-binding protein [Chthoniobacterales bacterium]